MWRRVAVWYTTVGVAAPHHNNAKGRGLGWAHGWGGVGCRHGAFVYAGGSVRAIRSHMPTPTTPSHPPPRARTHTFSLPHTLSPRHSEKTERLKDTTRRGRTFAQSWRPTTCEQTHHGEGRAVGTTAAVARKDEHLDRGRRRVLRVAAVRGPGARRAPRRLLLQDLGNGHGRGRDAASARAHGAGRREGAEQHVAGEEHDRHWGVCIPVAKGVGEDTTGLAQHNLGSLRR